jgi:hypothetical protein
MFVQICTSTNKFRHLIIEEDDTYRIKAERVIGWHGACTNVAVIGTKRRSKS